MKIILDCNVIISAGLKSGVCRSLVHHVLKYHELYVSGDILIEYKEVISRPKFKAVHDYLYALMESICELSELVEPQNTKYVLPDEDDVIYLKAALHAGVDYIITGNTKDCPQKKYDTTTIIKPSDFLHLCKIDIN